MSDETRWRQCLTRRRTTYLGHPLFLAMNSKLMQTLNHVPFTFQKRISGAEDAQNQRHRGTLSSSPVLSAHLRRDPDVIVPYRGSAVRGSPGGVSRRRSRHCGTPRTSCWMTVSPPKRCCTCCRTATTSASTRPAHCSPTTGSGSSGSATTPSARSSIRPARKRNRSARVFPTIGMHVSAPPCVVRSRASEQAVLPRR